NVRCVVDLGAAPGGWSQYLRRNAPKARIVALDRLPMAPVEGVTFLQVDFAEQEGLDALLSELGTATVALVLSDMAPNLSGVKVADEAGVMQPADLSLALCEDVLGTCGSLLINAFQGEGFDDLSLAMRTHFNRVTVCKSKASRDASREMYLLGTGWQN